MKFVKTILKAIGVLFVALCCWELGARLSVYL